MIDKKDFKGQMLRLDAMFMPGKFSEDAGKILLREYYNFVGKVTRLEDLRAAVDTMISDTETDYRGFNFPGPGQILKAMRSVAGNRVRAENVKQLDQPVNKKGIEEILKIAGPMKRI